MPTPAIPGPKLGTETGLPDASWINSVRDKLRDQPRGTRATWTADGTNGVRSAGAMPLTLRQRPVYDGAGSISVGVAPIQGNPSVDYPIDTTNPPAVGKVYVNYNTGEVTFNSAPAASNFVTVGYQWCKWTDQTILEALYAGLRTMFPIVGKTYLDSTVDLLTNQYDYQLPAWAQDPRSQILKVEVADSPTSIEGFRELRLWNRVGEDQINIPEAQAWANTGTLRITGWGPYLTLGDLEPQIAWLPVWYALGVIMGDQEAQDRRKDTTTPQSQEGANTVLEHLQMARHYMNLFNTELKRLERAAGPGYAVKILTSYEKNGAGAWRG